MFLQLPEGHDKQTKGKSGSKTNIDLLNKMGVLVEEMHGWVIRKTGNRL